MPTATAAANRPLSASHEVSGSETSRLGWSGPRSEQLLCPRRRCPPVPVAAGGGAMMTFRVVHKPSNSHVRCPYRVVEQATAREIDWINKYRRLRNSSPSGQRNSANLCGRLVALSPLVGECS